MMTHSDEAHTYRGESQTAGIEASNMYDAIPTNFGVLRDAAMTDLAKPQRTKWLHSGQLSVTWTDGRQPPRGRLKRMRRRNEKSNIAQRVHY